MLLLRDTRPLICLIQFYFHRTFGSAQYSTSSHLVEVWIVTCNRLTLTGTVQVLGSTSAGVIKDAVQYEYTRRIVID